MARYQLGSAMVTLGSWSISERAHALTTAPVGLEPRPSLADKPVKPSVLR